MFIDLKRDKNNCQTTYKPWLNKEFIVFTQIERLAGMQVRKELDPLGIHYFECTFELAEYPTLELSALAVC